MTPELSAQQLKQRWESLARTERRDYYIASHPGWDDPDTWARRAHGDASFVMEGFNDELLSHSNVLEIGCGVGRLVPTISKRVKSYTGIDIAASCITEARTRSAAFTNCRFFESSGTEVPETALDIKYDIIFAAAVLIHCPLDVIEKILASAWDALAPGGQLRFQLLGDLNDSHGIQMPLEVLEVMEEEQRKEAQAGNAQATNDGDTEAITEGYMGFSFSYAAAQALMDRILPHNSQLMRLSHAFIFGFATKTNDASP